MPLAMEDQRQGFSFDHTTNNLRRNYECFIGIATVTPSPSVYPWSLSALPDGIPDLGGREQAEPFDFEMSTPDDVFVGFAVYGDFSVAHA